MAAVPTTLTLVVVASKPPFFRAMHFRGGFQRFMVF